MTREEAIEAIKCTWPDSRYTILREALDMAISALRQKGQERNAPLTLDELRKMDGEPVWVQSPGVPEYGRWAIVEGVGENCLFLHDDFTCHEYGKTWLAYRQKPEEETK